MSNFKPRTQIHLKHFTQYEIVNIFQKKKYILTVSHYQIINIQTLDVLVKPTQQLSNAFTNSNHIFGHDINVFLNKFPDVLLRPTNSFHSVDASSLESEKLPNKSDIPDPADE